MTPTPLGRRALVTGATGFLGTHLLRHLACHGWVPRAATRRPWAEAPPGVEPLTVGELGPATDWMPSWPPVMMKDATLFWMSATSLSVTWFCTVHPLGHFEVERAGGAPANRRGHEHHVGPVHERLIHGFEFVLGVHLRERAGPGARRRGLGVVAFAVFELYLGKFDEPGFTAKRTLRVRERFG